MLFKQVNREDADVAFITVKNANASRAMVAGEPVIWETATYHDGNSVIDPSASNPAGLMAGVIDSDSIDAGQYGRMQVYGYRSANAYFTAAATIGDYLAPTVSGATPAFGVAGSGNVQAALFAGITAGATGAIVSRALFLRCM